MGKQPKSEITRRHILQSAATLFNTKGYAGTSMADITAATGLSKGAVYANFTSKEELAVAAFRQAVGRVQGHMREHTRAAGTLPDKLRALVRAYSSYADKPPVPGGCPIQNMATEADDAYPVILSEVRQAMNAWEDRMVRALEAACERGGIRAGLDHRHVARTFITLLQGGILMARLQGDAAYFQPAADQLYQLIQDLEPHADD
jgi:AcrR family transcriptional regulator